MDVPKTIPPLPDCDERSDLNDAASPKAGDQTTCTPPEFSLGSASFADLIFSEEVSQMESWLPEMADDCFQNVMSKRQQKVSTNILVGTLDTECIMLYSRKRRGEQKTIDSVWFMVYSTNERLYVVRMYVVGPINISC